MKRISMVAALLYLALTPLPVASHDAAAGRSAARGFVDQVWTQLDVRAVACPTLERQPPGAVRCGVLEGDSLYTTAHDLAFSLAERGVRLLNLESWTVPPNQLVELPGLARLPELPGYEAIGYLIETERVGIWTGRDRERPVVIFTLEEIGAFPEIIPADAPPD